jgi:ABC-2 type transport system permease protein
MLAGLITTKDTLYFFIIIYIFLGLSIYKLKAGMESTSVMVKTTRYVAVVASALLIGYVSSIPGLVGYWDTTFYQSRTLTPRVQKIVKDLGNEPLEVTAYVNLLDRYYYLGNATSYNYNIARWELYRRFKENIILKKVTYYDSMPSNFGRRNYAGKSTKEIAEQYAKSMDVDFKSILSPEQVKKQIDLTGEGNRYLMVLKWKGRTTRLRIFDDMFVWPGETEVAAALQRLQQATLPKIAFVNSELEREIDKTGDRDYKSLTNLPSFRQSLINQGFDVVSVSLDNDSIPGDIATLVLADPKIPLSPASLQKLELYVQQGGNLLIAGEPGKQSVLNPFLTKLGVQLNEGTILQASVNDAPDFVTAFVEKNAAPFYKLLAYAIEDSLRVTMPGVAGISYLATGPFSVQPLLKTDPANTWNRMKPVDLQTMVHATVSKPAIAPGGPHNSRRDSLGTIFFQQEGGDTMGPLTTAVRLERNRNGKQQRVVVLGDADFLSNKELSRYQRSANFVFGVSLFRWLTGGEFPIDTGRPPARDKKINTAREAIKFHRIIYIWMLPALLLAGAAVLLIRRKRK